MAWTLWPLSISRARSAGSETTAVLMFLLTVFLGTTPRNPQDSEQSPGIWDGLALSLTGAFAAQTRGESIVIALLCLFPFLKRISLMSGIGGVLCLFPCIVSRSISKQYMAENMAGDWHVFRTNLISNFRWLTDLNIKWDLARSEVIWIALIGLTWFLCRPKNKKNISIWLVFFSVPLISLVIYSNDAAGNFQTFRTTIRYCLIPFSFLVIWVGYAFDRIKLAAGATAWPWFCAMLCLAVFIPAVTYSSFLQSEIYDGPQSSRHEEESLSMLIQNFDSNSVFFTGEPIYLISQKKSAYHYSPLIAMSGENDPWWAWIRRRSDGNLYYIRGYECSYGQAASCDEIEKRFRLTRVFRHRIIDDYDLIVYKIEGLKNSPNTAAGT